LSRHDYAPGIAVACIAPRFAAGYVRCQVELAPHPSSVGSVLPDFPKDLQPCSVNDQMGGFTSGWRFYTDADVLCAYADQQIIQAVHRQQHEFKDRVHKAR